MRPTTIRFLLFGVLILGANCWAQERPPRLTEGWAATD